MKNFPETCRYLVLTGNYGSGKTEIALNLAITAAEHESTTLVDLDIVNPYFRSAEKRDELERAGVRVLMPTYAMTTVDIPALPAEIQSVFEVPVDRTIFDVGGDDTGAAALGRYYPSFAARKDSTCMYVVLNCMRPLTRSADEILELISRIENRGRLRADGLINNTNLADRTEPAMVEKGEKIALECASRLGISRVITAGTEEVLRRCALQTPVLPIRRMMKPEWMEAE